MANGSSRPENTPRWAEDGTVLYSTGWDSVRGPHRIALPVAGDPAPPTPTVVQWTEAAQARLGCFPPGTPLTCRMSIAVILPGCADLGATLPAIGAVRDRPFADAK